MQISEEQKLRWKRYFITMGFIIVLISSAIIFNAFVVKTGKHFKNINYAIGLTNNIADKNLSLPFPNISPIEADSLIGAGSSVYLRDFNLLFDNFSKVLNSRYYYDDDYDCKYWAYVWTLYWKNNRDRYNWELEYMETQNHIFVMVSNSSGYCILDGDEQVCLMS